MSDAIPPHRLSFDPETRMIGLRVGKVELGQHVHEAYVTLVADLTGMSEGRIQVCPVTTQDCPDDGMTVGSQSIQVTGQQIESAVRDQMEELRKAAGLRLNTAPSELSFDATELVFRQGSDVCDVFDLVDDTDVMALPPKEASSDAARTVLGQQRFIQDLSWPGMLYARALRGRVNGDIEPLLTSEDRLVEDEGFAAVVTRDEARLEALWTDLPAVTEPGDTSCDGPTNDWITTRRVTISGDTRPDTDLPHAITTSRPFIVHGSIAPSCAVALWSGQVLTIWCHSQGIFPLRAMIARVLDLEPTRVILHHVRSAGCYGHNGADDAAMDAALIAMQAEGAHVRVTWPRADDMRLAPLGAPMRVEARSKLDGEGRITHWHQEIYSGPHGQRPGGGGNVNLLAAMERDPSLRPRDVFELPDAVGRGAARNAAPIYDIPAVTARTHIVQDMPVRTSSLRGLGAQMNTIAIEAMMDNLARETDQSPFEFRLRHLSDPRARHVLETLETHCPTAGSPDEAVGIALGRYKNKAAYAAVAVHLRLEDAPRLIDVRAVIDAGRVVHDDGTRNQIEGGILQAASWTLCEGAYLRHGKVDASGWDEYPTLPWGSVPSLELHLVSTENEQPLGVGECMVGPVSAAIVNAVSACIGQPLTDLPLTREALISALA